MQPGADAIREVASRYAYAWTSGSPAAVAAFFAPEGRIAMNRGVFIVGRVAIEAVVTGFLMELPDLVMRLDGVRSSGEDALFLWTIEGTHSGTGNRVKVGGWEHWLVTPELEIAQSTGFYDADDYARQVGGG